MKNYVVAVVVTYNRKELLLECITAILKQSLVVNKLIIVDNASTDGTFDLLQAQGILKKNMVLYRPMETNIGGAGGFHEGIKMAAELNADWIWVMDDDTIPTVTCLENLLCAKDLIAKESELKCNTGPISYLASSVFGENNEFMNVPTISNAVEENGYESWYEFLENGIVSIDHATFVSVLINGNAIKKCGLPCKEFFIWGDDGEYTKRLSHYYGKAYMAGKSVAIHKRKNAKSLKYNFETDPKRIKMRHYLYRNLVIVDRYYNHRHYMAYLHLCKELIQYPIFMKDKLSRLRQNAKIKGYFEGITQYRKFKYLIDSQLR